MTNSDLIDILGKICDKSPHKDMKQFRSLFKFETLSDNETKLLIKTRLYDSQQLININAKLLANYNQMKAKFEELMAQQNEANNFF